MGWLVYKRLDRFLVLRDSYGTVQAVVDSKPELSKIVKDLPYESVVKVEGSVVNRGENANLKMKTGEIEINVSSLTVLNCASPHLPMLPDAKASEKTRLSNRHIDLRTDQMQRFCYFTYEFLTLSLHEAFILHLPNLRDNLYFSPKLSVMKTRKKNQKSSSYLYNVFDRFCACHILSKVS
ncbi:nucleic acid-binding domain protein, partial [Ostertagia ostertagi]